MGDERVDLACLSAGDRLYAVDVRQVREIVRTQEVTPLPSAPELVEGVTDLRGLVIPVVDLGRALCGRPVEAAPANRIAVLEAAGLRFGLRVDAAVDVVSVDAAALEDPPSLASGSSGNAVRALVRREGHGPLLVLSLENLIREVKRSDGAAAGGSRSPGDANHDFHGEGSMRPAGGEGVAG